MAPDPPAFAAALARLFEAEGAARLPALVQALRAGVVFDHWIAILFRPAQAPLLLGVDGTEEPEPPYHAGPYLLDPFFHRFQAGAHGWALLGEIAPAGFAASDYATGYFGALGVAHELGFVAPLQRGEAFHLSLTRARGARPFSRRERAWLEALSPLIAAAGRRIAPAERPDAAATLLHATLTRAFEHFGASVLTAREGEVVRLLLQGHLSKAIARRLGISPGTARNHLKRIYPKLGVASHSELYALFLKALRVAEGEGDPLERLPR
jgi:DNA-binding CsgD family transcriptional regulator